MILACIDRPIGLFASADSAWDYVGDGNGLGMSDMDELNVFMRAWLSIARSSPYQELYGKPASFQNCYPFGCAAYYYLGKRQNPGWKRQARGILSLLIWLGNWQGKKAFLRYNPLSLQSMLNLIHFFFRVVRADIDAL
jgi:hypothetical protein